MSELRIGRQALSDNQRLDIIGPDSALSRRQVHKTAKVVSDYGFDIYRACTFKPRSKPSPFEGVGMVGNRWLSEVARRRGLIVSQEVRTGDQVHQMVEAVGETVDVIVWSGARNIDHVNLRSIGEAAAQYANVTVGVKNPQHGRIGVHTDWVGNVEHVLSGGLQNDRLFLIHRGFVPTEWTPNEQGYKNPPHHELAMRTAEYLRRPIILDIAHTTGDASKAELLVRESVKYPYRGLMFESSTPHYIRLAKVDQQNHTTIQEARRLVDLHQSLMEIRRLSQLQVAAD